MHSKLIEIVEYKKNQVKHLKPVSLKRDKKILNVVESLSKKPFIAEYKKGSPSIGIIDENKDITLQVKQYEEYCAGMVSVLTDDRFFFGSFDDLRLASNVLNIPTLAKEFIISKIQIDYAYNAGASCILLIAAILDDTSAINLVEYAKTLGLYVLFEVHTFEEYERIKNLPFDMVGVNSRNLNTFQIDKTFAASIISRIDKDKFIVAESGIDGAGDVTFFKKAGAQAFLIGTFLMRHTNIKSAFDELYRGLQNVC
jgi:indole-3-glycerol phosphate synthase